MCLSMSREHASMVVIHDDEAEQILVDCILLLSWRHEEVERSLRLALNRAAGACLSITIIQVNQIMLLLARALTR